MWITAVIKSLQKKYISMHINRSPVNHISLKKILMDVLIIKCPCKIKSLYTCGKHYIIWHYIIINLYLL